MKIKVSELKGKKLAEWVARSQGWEWDDEWHGWKVNGKMVHYHFVDKYRPDINGEQAMDLAKKFKIGTSYNEETNTWFADALVITGDETPEIAICRAVVASVYGEYVEGSD